MFFKSNFYLKYIKINFLFFILTHQNYQKTLKKYFEDFLSEATFFMKKTKITAFPNTYYVCIWYYCAMCFLKVFFLLENILK
jgi:hypothetical protein